MSRAYNLFKEDENGAPIWVETVIGLDHVKERLEELARSQPGKYLIFNPTDAKFVEPFKKSA